MLHYDGTRRATAVIAAAAISIIIFSLLSYISRCLRKICWRVYDTPPLRLLPRHLHAITLASYRLPLIFHAGMMLRRHIFSPLTLIAPSRSPPCHAADTTLLMLPRLFAADILMLSLMLPISRCHILRDAIALPFITPAITLYYVVTVSMPRCYPYYAMVTPLPSA